MLPLRNPAKTPKCSSGKIYSNVTYFDSSNYEDLDQVILRRDEKRLVDEAIRERERQEELRKPVYPKIDIAAMMNAEKVPRQRPKQKPYYGLRRPLENGETIEIEPGDIDLTDWSDKPYSTIACQMLGYQDIYPLLMQKITKSAEKDAKKVQTETRRQSVVTADYRQGRIKLKNTKKGGKAVEYAVFPVMHKVVESPSDSEEDTQKLQQDHSPVKSPTLSSSSSSKSDVFSDLPALPVDLPRGFNVPLQRRRISVAGHGRHAAIPEAQVVRRRSLDYGGVSTAFVKALEAASNAMKCIEETDHDEEDHTNHADVDDGSPHRHSPSAYANAARAVFDPKYAEETMSHLDDNLHTLEEFLKTSSGSVVISEDEEDEDD